MKPTTLFTISDWYRQLGDLLTAQEGETSEVTDLLEKSISENIPETVNSLLLMAHEAEAQAGLYKQQVDTFKALQADCIGKAERLRGYVERFMQYHGIDSLPLPLFPKLGFKALPPKVEVADDLDFAKVPEVFIRVKPPEFNKVDFLKAWKSDPSLTVDGVTVVTNRTGLTGETIKESK